MERFVAWHSTELYFRIVSATLAIQISTYNVFLSTGALGEELSKNYVLLSSLEQHLHRAHTTFFVAPSVAIVPRSSMLALRRAALSELRCAGAQGGWQV